MTRHRKEPEPPEEVMCSACGGIGEDKNAGFWCSKCHGTGYVPAPVLGEGETPA